MAQGDVLESDGGRAAEEDTEEGPAADRNEHRSSRRADESSSGESTRADRGRAPKFSQHKPTGFIDRHNGQPRPQESS